MVEQVFACTLLISLCSRNVYDDTAKVFFCFQPSLSPSNSDSLDVGDLYESVGHRDINTVFIMIKYLAEFFIKKSYPFSLSSEGC